MHVCMYVCMYVCILQNEKIEIKVQINIECTWIVCQAVDTAPCESVFILEVLGWGGVVMCQRS